MMGVLISIDDIRRKAAGEKVSDETMTDPSKEEQKRAARRAYLNAWRKRNPEKVRAQKMRYWRRRILRELEEEKHNG